MGQLILPKTGPVYIDVNTAIYRFEGIEPYVTTTAPLWESLQNQQLIVVTSELSLLEVLVKPIRDHNHALIAIYRRVLLETRGLVSLPIDREILELAARVRAECRLKTPDAIHAASSMLAGAAMFLTNDLGFRRVPGLNVVILDELASED